MCVKMCVKMRGNMCVNMCVKMCVKCQHVYMSDYGGFLSALMCVFFCSYRFVSFCIVWRSLPYRFVLFCIVFAHRLCRIAEWTPSRCIDSSSHPVNIVIHYFDISTFVLPQPRVSMSLSTFPGDLPSRPDVGSISRISSSLRLVLDDSTQLLICLHGDMSTFPYVSRHVASLLAPRHHCRRFVATCRLGCVPCRLDNSAPRLFVISRSQHLGIPSTSGSRQGVCLPCASTFSHFSTRPFTPFL